MRDIAAAVARARLAGARRDDSELKLTIRRAFTKGVDDAHVTLHQQLIDQEAQSRALDRQLQDRLETSAKQKAAFVPLRATELRRQATADLNRSALIKGGASALLLIAAIPLAHLVSSVFTGSSTVLDSGVTLGLVAIALGPVVQHFKGIRAELLGRIGRAEGDAADEWTSREFGRS